MALTYDGPQFNEESITASPLAAALDELDRAIEYLEKNLASLSERVSPLTSEREVPTDPSPGDADTDTVSDVVRRIRNQRITVDRIANRVNELTYRLDV